MKLVCSWVLSCSVFHFSDAFCSTDALGCMYVWYPEQGGRVGAHTGRQKESTTCLLASKVPVSS